MLDKNNNSVNIEEKIEYLLSQVEDVNNYVLALENPIDFAKDLEEIIYTYYLQYNKGNLDVSQDALYRLLKLYLEITFVSCKVELRVLRGILIQEPPEIKLLALQILRNQVNVHSKEDMEILSMLASTIPGCPVLNIKEDPSNCLLRELTHSHKSYKNELIHFKTATVSMVILNGLFEEAQSEIKDGNGYYAVNSNSSLVEKADPLILQCKSQIVKRIITSLEVYFNPNDHKYLNFLKSNDEILKLYTEYSIEVLSFIDDGKNETLKNVIYSVLFFGYNLDDDLKIKILELLIKRKDYSIFTMDFIIDKTTLHQGISDYGKMLYVEFLHKCLLVHKKNFDGFEKLLMKFISEIKISFSPGILRYKSKTSSVYNSNNRSLGVGSTDSVKSSINSTSSHNLNGSKMMNGVTSMGYLPEDKSIPSNIAMMNFLIRAYTRYIYLILGEDPSIKALIKHTNILFMANFMINYDVCNDEYQGTSSSLNDLVNYVDGSLVDLFEIEKCKLSIIDLSCVYISYINKKGIILYYEDHLLMKEIFMIPVKLNISFHADKFYQMFMLLGEPVFNTIVSMVSEDLIVKYYDRIYIWQSILNVVGTPIWLTISQKANELIFEDFISNQFKSYSFYKSMFPVLYHFVLYDKDYYRNYFSNHFATIFKCLINYNGSSYSPHFTIKHSIMILKDMFTFLNTKTNLYAGYCVTYSHIDIITHRLFELYCVFNDPFYLDVLFRLPSSFALLQTKFPLFRKPIIHGIRNNLIVQAHFSNFIIHIALFDSKNVLDDILVELFILLNTSNSEVKENVMNILTKSSGKHIKSFTPKLFLGAKERYDAVYDAYVEILIGMKPIFTTTRGITLVNFGNTVAPIGCANRTNENFIGKVKFQGVGRTCYCSYCNSRKNDHLVAETLKEFLVDINNFKEYPITFKKILIGLLIYEGGGGFSNTNWAHSFILSNTNNSKSFLFNQVEVLADCFRISLIYSYDSSLLLLSKIKSLRIYNEMVKAIIKSLNSDDQLYQYTTLRFISQIDLSKLVESTLLLLKNGLNFVTSSYSSPYIDSVSQPLIFSDFSVVITLKKVILELLVRQFKLFYTEAQLKPSLPASSMLGQIRSSNSINYSINDIIVEITKYYESPLSTKVLFDYIKSLTASNLQNSKNIFSHYTLYLNIKKFFNTQMITSYPGDEISTSFESIKNIYKKTFPIIAVLDDSTLADIRVELLNKFCSDNSVNTDLFFNSLKLISLIFYNQKVSLAFATLFIRAYEHQPRDLLYEILSNFKANERKVVEFLVKLNKEITPILKESIQLLIFSNNTEPSNGNVVISKDNFLYFLLSSIEIPNHRRILFHCVDPNSKQEQSQPKKDIMEKDETFLLSNNNNTSTHSIVITAVIEFLNNIVNTIDIIRKNINPLSSSVYDTLKNHKVYQNNLLEHSIKGFYILEYLAEYNLTFNDTETVKNMIFIVAPLIAQSRIEKILEIYIHLLSDEEIIEILSTFPNIIIKSQTIFSRILSSNCKLKEFLIPSIVYLIEMYKTFDTKLISKVYFNNNEIDNKEDVVVMDREVIMDKEVINNKLINNKLVMDNIKELSYYFFNSLFYNKSLFGGLSSKLGNTVLPLQSNISNISPNNFNYNLNNSLSVYKQINYDVLIVPFSDRLESLIDLFNRINVKSSNVLEICKTIIKNDCNLHKKSICIKYIKHNEDPNFNDPLIPSNTNLIVKNFYSILLTITPSLFRGGNKKINLFSNTQHKEFKVKRTNINYSNEDKIKLNKIFSIILQEYPNNIYFNTIKYLLLGDEDCSVNSISKWPNLDINLLKFIHLSLICINHHYSQMTDEELFKYYMSSISVKQSITSPNIYNGGDSLLINGNLISPTEFKSEALHRLLEFCSINQQFSINDFLYTLTQENSYNLLFYLISNEHSSTVTDSNVILSQMSKIVENLFTKLIMNSYKQINKFICLFDLLVTKYPNEVSTVLLSDTNGYPPAISRSYLLFPYLTKEISIRLCCDYKPKRLTTEMFCNNLYHLLLKYPELVPNYLSHIVASKDKRMIEMVPYSDLLRNKILQLPTIENNYRYYFLFTILIHSSSNIKNTFLSKKISNHLTFNKNCSSYGELYNSLEGNNSGNLGNLNNMSGNLNNLGNLNMSGNSLEGNNSGINENINVEENNTVMFGRKSFIGICKVKSNIREIKLICKLIILKEYKAAYFFYNMTVERISKKSISYSENDVKFLRTLHYLIMRKLFIYSDNINAIIDLDINSLESMGHLSEYFYSSFSIKDEGSSCEINSIDNPSLYIETFTSMFGKLMRLVLSPNESLFLGGGGGNSPQVNKKSNITTSISNSINQILDFCSNHIHKIPKSKSLNKVLTNLTVITEIKNCLEIMNRPAEVILSFIKIWSYRFPVDEYIYFYKWRMFILEKYLLSPSSAIVESHDNKKKVQLLTCGVKLKYAEHLMSKKKYKIAQQILNEGMQMYLLDSNHKFYKILMDLECSYNLKEYSLMLFIIGSFNITKCKKTERGLIYYWAYKAKKELSKNISYVDVSAFGKVSSNLLYKLCKTIYPTNLIKQEEFLYNAKSLQNRLNQSFNNKAESEVNNLSIEVKLLIEICNDDAYCLDYLIDIITINPLYLLKVKSNKIFYFIEAIKNERIKEAIYERFPVLNQSYYKEFMEYQEDSEREFIFPDKAVLIGEFNNIRKYTNTLLASSSSSSNNNNNSGGDNNSGDKVGGDQEKINSNNSGTGSTILDEYFMLGCRQMYSIIGRDKDIYTVRLTNGEIVRLDFKEFFINYKRTENIKEEISKNSFMLSELVNSQSTEIDDDAVKVKMLLSKINEFKLSTKSEVDLFKLIELIDFRLKLGGLYFQVFRSIIVIEEGDVELFPDQCLGYSSIFQLFKSISRDSTSLITLCSNFFKTYSIYLFFELFFFVKFNRLFINLTTGKCKYGKVVLKEGSVVKDTISSISDSYENVDPTTVIGMLTTLSDIHLNGVVIGNLYDYLKRLMDGMSTMEDDQHIHTEDTVVSDAMFIKKYVSYFMGHSLFINRINNLFLDTKKIKSSLFPSSPDAVTQSSCELCISGTELSKVICTCKISKTKILEKDNLISGYLECFKIEKVLNDIIIRCLRK